MQGPQALAQGRQEKRVDLAGFVKANFGFGGMDVDVHGLGRQAQVYHRRGVPAPGQEPGIDLAQNRPQDTVDHHPAVHQEDLEAGAGQGEIRRTHETRHLPGPLGKRQGEHMGREFRAPDRGHPFHQRRGSRGRQHGPGRGGQGKVDLGVAQGQVAQRAQDLGLFGFRTLQKFLPGRGVEKEFRHLHLGAGRRRRRRGFDDLPGASHHLKAPRGPRGAADEAEPAHRGDGGQGLPPKTQAGDGQQVGLGGQLAGGVAPEAQGHLGGRHAGPVVHHPDEPAAAFLHHHRDGAGPGVQGVLHQFLDRRRRADDDLPGGDFGRHLGVQDTDAAHGFPLAIGLGLVYHVP